MPVFEVHIDREVIRYDRFTRYIEAPNEDAARAIGDKLAAQADADCPDDAGDGDFDPDYGGWSVNEVEVMSQADADEWARDILTAAGVAA